MDLYEFGENLAMQVNRILEVRISEVKLKINISVTHS